MFSFAKEYLGHILGFILLVCTFTYWFRLEFVPTHDINYYSKLLIERGLSKNDINFPPEDVTYFTNCNSIECSKKFYENYTIENGVKKAFLHLSKLNSMKNGDYVNCHQNAHAIGHAAYKLGKVSFDELVDLEKNGGAILQNMTGCGNGYYHGIVEEIASSEKRNKAKTFNMVDICKDTKIRYFSDKCKHGVGHAAFLQTGELLQSLLICDGFTDPISQAMCYPGVFMQKFAFEALDNDKFSLDVCKVLPEKYQTACYAEVSILFSRKNNEKTNFSKIIELCQKIEVEKYKIACIMKVAIRSTNKTPIFDTRKMCQSSTHTKVERIMCTVSVAVRLSFSFEDGLEVEDKLNSRRVIDDVCNTLAFYESGLCKKYAKFGVYDLNIGHKINYEDF